VRLSALRPPLAGRAQNKEKTGGARETRRGERKTSGAGEASRSRKDKRREAADRKGVVRDDVRGRTKSVD
jgi:hypothetical protein